MKLRFTVRDWIWLGIVALLLLGAAIENHFSEKRIDALQKINDIQRETISIQDMNIRKLRGEAEPPSN